MSGSVHISFGSWLLERRRAAGITQDELAERIDCAPITLQKIVSGKRRPSRQIALLLAAYFGVPEDEHEAFVTFARASSPAPSTSSPASPNDKPGEGTTLPTEAQNNAPWRAVHLSKSNLPLALTTLIGREEELEEICSRLRQPKIRLLTVTGSPGTGKTSLGIEVAASLLDDFEDGVYLVELATLNDPTTVIPSIARTLDLRETGGQSIEETFLAYVKDKRILLVLDNFEHLLDAGPEVVKLIQASPWLKVLITSREALHVRGERQYPLSPLRLPVLAHRPSLEELARNPAVELFVERTQAVMDFELTGENAGDVAAICITLDGLPLAIELAAARAVILSPQQIRASLHNRLKFLSHGARDLPPRQRTLRGAIEWSHDLLDEGEKQLIRRLAVFQGGCTLQAGEAICNSEYDLQVDVLEGLASLVRRSLLQRREGRDGKSRFWMLETIQEYALEKLEESGEGKALQREHALYFMGLAERVEPQGRGEQQQEWLNRLEDEYDNLSAALGWCGEQGQGGSQERAEIGLRTAGALSRFWQVRGMYTEGREQLERALSVPEGVLTLCSPGSRALALTGAGYLAGRQGDYSSAHSLSQGSLVLGREAGDKQSISRALNNLGSVAYEQGDYTEARALFEESLVLRRELGDKWDIAMSLNSLGVVAYEQGDYTGARALYEESLAVKRELGDTWGIAMSLSNLGLVVYEQGDYTEARALHEQSLALRRELGDKWGIILSLNNLGFVASQHGDYTGARALHEEGLALGREIGDKKGVAACLVGLGGVAVGMGEVERGTKLLSAVQGLVEKMGAVMQRDDRLPYERAVASACSVLGDEAFEKAMQKGRGMSLEEAVGYALEVPHVVGGRP